MDGGAGLVTLERSEVGWRCRSNSAVLSQQFDKEASIILTNRIILLVVNSAYSEIRTMIPSLIV